MATPGGSWRVHRSRSARGLWRAAGVFLLGGLVACGADDAASITDRLWVSDVPSNPREEISAFAISNLRGRKLGALYQGSLYQGTQRGFRLELEGRRAVFEMLQDGSRYPVTVQTCKAGVGAGRTAAARRGGGRYVSCRACTDLPVHQAGREPAFRRDLGGDPRRPGHARGMASDSLAASRLAHAAALPLPLSAAGA